MIIGLNTAPVGMIMYPLCAVCTELTHKDFCQEKTRVFRTDDVDLVVHRGNDYAIYREKDAVDVQCLGCLKNYSTSCNEFSFDNGRYLLFVEDGNVYVRIAGGRINQVIEIIASVVLDTGREIPLNIKIIIER